jgi:hypothetical protein
MGGSVEVRSVAGVGSTFALLLPSASDAGVRPVEPAPPGQGGSVYGVGPVGSAEHEQ